MSFDARREDYQRMSLRFERTLDDLPPNEAMHAYATFSRRFARDYDNLPQTDADRAFHLVSKAALLIDYELPFAENELKAHTLIDRAHDLLSEAISLDPDCIDARRMLAASEQIGFDNFYEYLIQTEPAIAESCCAAREAENAKPDDQRASLARELAIRPYLRWLATAAGQALICGRNREALRLCTRSLQEDPADTAGVRFYAVYAYAKLEDAAGLEDFIKVDHAWSQKSFELSAWVLIAKAALAYKQRNYQEAGSYLEQIARKYPHACAALIRQQEFPEGVFSRVYTDEFSENELIVALSEAAILLQEGREVQGRGPFGDWVARAAEQMAPSSERAEVVDALHFAQEKAAQLEQMRKFQGGEGDELS